MAKDIWIRAVDGAVENKEPVDSQGQWDALRDGLVMVHDDAGTISVLFDLPRNAVTAALHHVGAAFKKTGMVGTTVKLHNFRYDDMANASWDDFMSDSASGSRMLVQEGETPHDVRTMNRVEAALEGFQR